MTADIALELELDRKLAWRRGDSRRYVRARVTAAPSEGDSPRPAMNIVLVIDASQSMSGPRIDAARRAAAGALEAFQADDRLTLVSFSDEVIVHCAGLRMDDAGNAEARAQIGRIACRGRTNLSEGWFLAVIASAGVDVPAGMATRVVLLSDGHANLGITSPAALAKHAAELLARNVMTSCLGIGDGYDEHLLTAIAEAGGGRMLDAEMAEEIETVLLAEIGASTQTMADALHLTLTPPEGTRAELIGFRSNKITRETIEVPLGALVAGASRSVILALTLPPGEIGTTLQIRATLTGRNPRTATALSPIGASTAVTFASSDENTPQPRNVDVSLDVVKAWMAHVMRRAVEMKAQGNNDTARDYLEIQKRFFALYVSGLPGDDELYSEMCLLKANIEKDWTVRTRKEMNYYAHRALYNEKDFRKMSRAGWADRLKWGV